MPADVVMLKFNIGWMTWQGLMGFYISTVLTERFLPEEWLESKFSLQHHPRIKHQGHENNENDHQLKKLENL